MRLGDGGLPYRAAGEEGGDYDDYDTEVPNGWEPLRSRHASYSVGQQQQQLQQAANGAAGGTPLHPHQQQQQQQLAMRRARSAPIRVLALDGIDVSGPGGLSPLVVQGGLQQAAAGGRPRAQRPPSPAPATASEDGAAPRPGQPQQPQEGSGGPSPVPNPGRTPWLGQITEEHGPLEWLRAPPSLDLPQAPLLAMPGGQELRGERGATAAGADAGALPDRGGASAAGEAPAGGDDDDDYALSRAGSLPEAHGRHTSASGFQRGGPLGSGAAAAGQHAVFSNPLFEGGSSAGTTPDVRDSSGGAPPPQAGRGRGRGGGGQGRACIGRGTAGARSAREQNGCAVPCHAKQAHCAVPCRGQGGSVR